MFTWCTCSLMTGDICVCKSSNSMGLFTSDTMAIKSPDMLWGNGSVSGMLITFDVFSLSTSSCSNFVMNGSTAASTTGCISTDDSIGVDIRVTGVETRVTGVDTRVTGVETRETGVVTRETGVATRVTGVVTRVTGVVTRVTGVDMRDDGS